MNGHTPDSSTGSSRSRVAEWAALVGEDVPDDRLSENRLPTDPQSGERLSGPDLWNWHREDDPDR